MNLRTAYQKASAELKKFGSGALDSKVLLIYAIDEDEKYLVSNPLFPLTNSQYSKFRRYIRRRKSGEPVAYIVGHKEFYGLDFKVNKNVLIPRPETELLVEQAIEFIKSKVHKATQQCHPRPDRGSTIVDSRFQPEGSPFRGGNDNLQIIDIGTGSSCIIISLANSLRTTDYLLQTKMYASDISKKALAVAKFNAKKHLVNNSIRFYCSDLFSNPKLPKKYDLIFANLPYLKPDYKNLDFEPRSALDGGKDGLEIVQRMIKILPRKLKSRGIALLEIGGDQYGKVKKLIDKSETLKIELIKTIPGWHGSIKITRT